MRAQLADKVSAAIRHNLDDDIAGAVLDAILPLVTTPAELDALPVNSKLLDDSGHIYSVYHHLTPAVDANFRAHLAKHLSLTLVWSPR